VEPIATTRKPHGVSFIFVIVPCAVLRCGPAQLVVRRLAVRQARVRISARHPMEAPLAERRRDEDSRRRA
jgi:hypothetical protein